METASTIKHIVVCLDAADEVPAVLRLARRLVRSGETRVTLLRVLPAYAAHGSRVARAARALRESAALMGSAGPTARVVVRQGDLAEEILAEVHELGADRLVVSARTHAAIRHALPERLAGNADADSAAGQLVVPTSIALTP